MLSCLTVVLGSRTRFRIDWTCRSTSSKKIWLASTSFGDSRRCCSDRKECSRRQLARVGSLLGRLGSHSSAFGHRSTLPRPFLPNDQRLRYTHRERLVIIRPQIRPQSRSPRSGSNKFRLDTKRCSISSSGILSICPKESRLLLVRLQGNITCLSPIPRLCLSDHATIPEAFRI